MSPKFAPFIFNWPGQTANAQRTQAALEAVFGRVTVINSDESQSVPGWIDVGNDAYFTRQFLAALERFDGDVLFHVQADASYRDWRGVVDRAMYALDRYRWGVFAPHVDFSNWTAAVADLAGAGPEDLLRGVACTDCTCWFIHRSVLEQLVALLPVIRRGRLGMGIDVTACALSWLDGRPVLRDYAHVVDHPRSRGYDTTEARAELAAFLAAMRAEGEVGELAGMILHQRKALPAWLAARANPGPR